MNILKTIVETKVSMNELHKQGKSIGFVATMGALHDGHLQLIKQSKRENDYTICSIFINPIQFNKTEDLEKYPNQIEKDIELLEAENCDFLFNPSVEEMYPEIDQTEFDFGNLEDVMEGANRPGHFRGVAIVVKRLFEIIEPTRAYFGKKDYQQLLIVNSLVEQYNLSPEIIGCEIIREESGLAMSSRNQRLSFGQKRKAPSVYTHLKKARDLKEYLAPDVLKRWIEEKYIGHDDFRLEYIEVADGNNLQPIEKWEDTDKPMIFIVVHMGAVRLIDNIELY
ncbi:MAG: pantoate--beta-alanine ligase [Bacteroidales bacterium]|nr:pantoate--beta-alanine ligase [Bacteroidales bacterium]